MDNTLKGATGNLSKSIKADLQKAALIILKESKLRRKSVKTVVEELAGNTSTVITINLEEQLHTEFHMAPRA